MNRADFQALASIRLREARTLFRARQYAGAYYLAGYAIECALKACIAKQTREHDFPDRKTVNDSYSHNLDQLLRVAGLDDDLTRETERDPDFGVHWSLVKDWSEESRYRRTARRDADDLIQAVSNRRHGVLKWIRERW
jgi:hypothetical protein